MQKGFAPIILILVIAGLILAGGFWAYQNNFQNIRKINSFEDCTKAGYPILLSYPGQCNTPDGQHFTQQISEEEKRKLIALPDETANWKIYTDDKNRFEFKYPQNSKIVYEGEGELMIESQDPSDEYFSFKLTYESVNLNIDAKDFIDQLTSSNEYQAAVNQGIVSQSSTSAALMSNGPETKDYKNGEIDGLFYKEGFDSDYAVVVAVKNNLAFRFTMSGENGIVNDYGLKLFDQILSTFKFLD